VAIVYGKHSIFRIFVEKIGFFILLIREQRSNNHSEIKMLEKRICGFCTCFPRKLLKTVTPGCFVILSTILVASFLVSSCTYVKKTTSWISKKEGAKDINNALLSKTEEETKKALGEPDIVSIMPDGTILWTYKPSWKLLPNNTETVYIEFQDGKVTKAIRGR